MHWLTKDAKAVKLAHLRGEPFGAAALNGFEAAHAQEILYQQLKHNPLLSRHFINPKLFVMSDAHLGKPSTI